ncbi:MAG TPA: recombinase family protein [Mycobacterium sp.]
MWKLDRLGRNTLNILETVKALTDQGVTLCRPPTASTPNRAAASPRRAS